MILLALASTTPVVLKGTVGDHAAQVLERHARLAYAIRTQCGECDGFGSLPHPQYRGERLPCHGCGGTGRAH